MTLLSIIFGFMGGYEWILILLAVLLLFGGKKIPELISMKFYSDQYYAKALELNGKHWEALRKVIEETVNLARRVSLYEFFE